MSFWPSQFPPQSDLEITRSSGAGFSLRGVCFSFVFHQPCNSQSRAFERKCFKNRENKITGIFREEAFEVSSLLISLSVFHPSMKEEEKELITVAERKVSAAVAVLHVRRGASEAPRTGGRAGRQLRRARGGGCPAEAGAGPAVIRGCSGPNIESIFLLCFFFFKCPGQQSARGVLPSCGPENGTAQAEGLQRPFSLAVRFAGRWSEGSPSLQTGGEPCSTASRCPFAEHDLLGLGSPRRCLAKEMPNGPTGRGFPWPPALRVLGLLGRQLLVSPGVGV